MKPWNSKVGSDLQLRMCRAVWQGGEQRHPCQSARCIEKNNLGQVAMHQQQVLKLVFIPQTNSKCSDETTAKGLLAIASNWQSCLDCWFVVILWWNQWALQDLKTLGLWWHVQILEWKTERLQAANKLKNIWASFHLVQKECHGPDKQYRYIFQSNACTNSMWILSSLQSFKALL